MTTTWEQAVAWLEEAGAFWFDGRTDYAHTHQAWEDPESLIFFSGHDPGTICLRADNETPSVLDGTFYLRDEEGADWPVTPLFERPLMPEAKP